MSTRNYLVACLVIAVVWGAALLYVPGLSDAVESLLLGFLATNAR